MSQIHHSGILPSAMEEKLALISRRQAVIAVLRAVSIGVSVLFASMVVAMLIDWQLTLFSTAWRTTLTLSSFLLSLAVVLATGVPALAASLKRIQAAANADQSIPQLEERWQTVVEVTDSKRATSSTSRAMLQQVTREAVAIGRIVQPQRVTGPKSHHRALQAMAGCALLLVGFLALDWPQTSVLFRRFFAPMSNITATSLNCPTGDVTIARGEFLDLVADLAGFPRKSAKLTLVHVDSQPKTVELAVDKQHAARFVHRLQANETFQYRVRAGDGQTAWHTVTVVDYPELAEVKFTIMAPAYLHRPNVEKSVIPGRLKVMQGSVLNLQLRPKSHLQRLDLAVALDNLVEGQPPPAPQLTTLKASADGWYRFETQLTENQSISPRLWNSFGLTNQDAAVCRIQVIVDNAPVARVLNPTDEMAVAADEIVDIKFEAHDDHGIRKAELVVYDESAAAPGKPAPVLKVIPIPLEDQELAKHVVGTTKLDLKELGLKPGTQVSYAVRVTDNREASSENPAKSPNEQRATANTDSKSLAEAKFSLNDAVANRGSQDSAGDETAEAKETSEKMVAAPSDAGGPADEEANESAHVSEKSVNLPNPPGTETASNSAGQPAAEASQTLANPSTPAEDEAPVPTERKSNAGTPEESVARGTDSAQPDQKGVAKGASDAADEESQPESNASTETAEKPSTSSLGSTTKDIEQSAKKAENDTAGHKATDADQAQQPDRSTSETASEPGNSNDGHDAKSPQGKSSPSDQGSPPVRALAMAPQQSESGQNSETKRRILKITERLSAVAAARESLKVETINVREKVLEIDGLLAQSESGLTRIVNREIPVNDQSAQYKALDTQLGNIEGKISTLRKETRDEQFAFVGLQMLDIGRSHVTPAREKVFVAIREPVSASSGSSRAALQQLVRARELLAALLKRYDRVARDKQLAEALKDGVKMYEVYVDKMQQLMREARQNQNPLDRKMAVIDVDQEYLDRYAEVLTMRRDMLAEFGRILGDDPRLLARYLDLVKRRRSSLRDQLSELAKWQKEIFVELSGWEAADTVQRADLWNVAVELRMQASTQLAKDAAELGERIEKQFPLILESTQRTPAKVIALGREITEISRGISLEAKRQIREPNTALDLRPKAGQLTALFVELDATLEQLGFENSKETEVTTYVTGRLLESRTVADQADLWKQTVEHGHGLRYHGFIEVDQHRIAIATELLRVDLLGIEAELGAQFQQLAERSIPEPIVAQIHRLQQLMQDITFEQSGAEFAMAENRLPVAEKLLRRASENFTQAEELFDELRRAIASSLDESTIPNPTIAELEDPKLDDFLTQLEREPNIDAQLGIPDRPRNLRVIADSLTWQEEGPGQLGAMEEDARGRMKSEQKERTLAKGSSDAEQPEKVPDEKENELTEEDRQTQEKLAQIRDELARAMDAQKERTKDPAADPEELKQLARAAKEAQEKLEKIQQAIDPEKLWKPMKADLEKTLAMLQQTKKESSRPDDSQRVDMLTKDLQRLLDEIRKEPSADNRWKMVAEFESKKSVLKAIAKGERIPDEQWNKLLSKLDDGLWQVGGRSLPEEYRKAIEQYQEQIRKLTNSGREDDE